MKDKEAKPLDPPALDSQVQTHIGRQLRNMFNQVASEPIPDRFVQLLDELERADKRASGAGAGQGDAETRAASASELTK